MVFGGGHCLRRALAKGDLPSLVAACRFKPQEVANLFWALAVLKACQADTWSLLLDKLATVPPSSFDHADQHQLYQVYMLLDATGHPPPPLDSLLLSTSQCPFAFMLWTSISCTRFASCQMLQISSYSLYMSFGSSPQLPLFFMTLSSISYCAPALLWLTPDSIEAIW